MEVLTQVHDVLKPYYSSLALLFTWAGLGFVWYQRRRDWKNKEFLGQVNFSLNVFEDTLLIRTLLEAETREVWPNAYGVGLLRTASKRTTAAQPFIVLPNKVDREYLFRAVKNSLSELCPGAFIASALGVPVKRGTFRFALTCERYPEIRTVKLRVLLVEEHALRDWCAPGGKASQLPMSKYYRTRLVTLYAMYELLLKNSDDLGRIELAVVAG